MTPKSPRRSGIATRDFQNLKSVWGHADVSIKKKVHYLSAFVISGSMYGLTGMWLVTAQRRRLDGFCARCLRQILHIQPAQFSRVSNAAVFAKAGVSPLSDRIFKQQLMLLGKVARSPEDSPLRRDTFDGDTLRHQIGRFVRRVGRPRQTWLSQVWNIGVSKFGSSRLESLVSDRAPGAQKRWQQKLSEVFK